MLTLGYCGIPACNGHPPEHCECGGYIGWTEYDDRWEGSCYGICSGYPVLPKTA